MNIDIQRINEAHGLYNNYKSPLADTFNGNTLLQNYVKAKLTQRKTVRLLLDKEQLQAQEDAIAQEIANKVTAIFK